MLTLAFYIGRGNMFDRVIRWATRSNVSHVEILTELPETFENVGTFATVLGSSPRDGGVREVEIEWNPEHWQVIEVPWAPADAVARARAEIGAGYDWLGILLSQVLALHRGSRARWYCSELVIHLIGPPGAQLSPGELRDLLFFMNNVVATSQCRAVSGR